MGQARIIFSGIFGMIAAMATCSNALAQPRDDVPRAPITTDPPRAETIVEKRPNTDLIASGALTLGIPYVASVVAAAQSSRQGDPYLYVPIAGPWLDFAIRDSCPQGSSCGNENAYKVLLVINGVLQGIGAAEILAGFIFPVSHKTTVVTDSTLRVAPQVSRTGYGLTATGTF